MAFPCQIRRIVALFVLLQSFTSHAATLSQNNQPLLSVHKQTAEHLTAQAGPPGASHDRPNVAPSNSDWRRCTNVEIVGTVCVEAYAVPSNLTVGLRFTVRGIAVYDRHFDGHRECADERELLRLIEHDPKLLPFKPVIDKIIKDWSIVPAHLFLICTTINDLHYTKHNVTGCVTLERKILCYKSKCYAEGVKDLGCFNIPIKPPVGQ